MLKRLRRLALCLVLLGAVALAYAWWIEPRWLQVKEHYLTQSALEQDVTLVCFGDTHVGLDTTAEDLARWVEQINRQQPDVVVFLGDLFDDYSQYQGDPEEVVQALADIRAADKLAVVGNHDVGGGSERVYEGLMERAGFTVLRNESAECQGIRFIGADEMLFYHPDVTGLSGQGICNTLLCHEPDFADEAEPFALMLAGHTHGGQVRLPFCPPFVRPPGGEGYTAGFYQTAKGTLYVNRGLGMTSLPLRFGARPELTVFHLQAGQGAE